MFLHVGYFQLLSISTDDIGICRAAVDVREVSAESDDDEDHHAHAKNSDKDCAAQVLGDVRLVCRVNAAREVGVTETRETY